MAGRKIPQTPPMGWNSFDCFGSSVTEAEVKANIDYMAEHLHRYGWEYIVVDFCWSHPAPGAVSNPNLEHHFGHFWPQLTMDEYGRLLPAPERFPSAQNGEGFRPLADYAHQKGLKFGIHVMRGIPRQAALAKLPIAGTDTTADCIINTEKLCNWLNHMYGVDMSQPGAQVYYDSVFKLYAQWGVDYVKVDDMIYPYHEAEIEAVWQAVQHSGRDMVVSLSCGPAPVEKVSHLRDHCHLWRISADFWDSWPLLQQHFELCRYWVTQGKVGHWPDADMLPLGHLSLRGPKGNERYSWYTQDEQILLMTLLAIFRSPLMFGGNLPDNDDFTTRLITNAEVLAVNQQSIDNQHLFTREAEVAWCASIPNSDAKYLAIFNLADDPNTAFKVDLAALGFNGNCLVRDLWDSVDLGECSETLVSVVPAHGARLYCITPC